MIRTQVQLPDELYEAVRRVAKSRELSIAEVLRRGAEYIVQCYPAEAESADTWAPPTPRALGEFLAPQERWHELAWAPDAS
jgi:hypothetical protein